MTELPDYDDLPRTAEGAPYAWHLFGEGDNVGTLNLQSPEGVVAAASLVRKGSVFPLNAPLDLFVPSLSANRSDIRHTPSVNDHGRLVAGDDVIDNFYPQGSSQWDALSHAGLGDIEVGFYNGATAAEVLAGQRNGIDHWARRGIAGRAVVLDLESGERDYDPGTNHVFTVDDLERARIAAGVEFRPGDVIILNTGFAKWYSRLDTREKRAFARSVKTPGVDHSEDICRYLWNAHPAAVVSDTFAVEVFPPDLRPESAPFGFIHQILIGGFGLALGELWWLADLVDDCRADGVYECLLVSAPLNVTGGMGSTSNALAIK